MKMILKILLLAFHPSNISDDLSLTFEGEAIESGAPFRLCFASF
jgi:hypothetical protein